jgi:hypothetical protein
MCIHYYSCFQIIFIHFIMLPFLFFGFLALWLFELLIRVPIQLVLFPRDSAPFLFRICDQIYLFLNPHLIIIRFALNPPKKHGRGYGKGKIWSNPFTSLLPWDKWLVFHSRCLSSVPPTVVSRPTMPLNNIFLSCFLDPPWPLPQKITYVTFASKGIYMEKY